MPSGSIIHFWLNSFDANLDLGSAIETNWSFQLSREKDGRLKSMVVTRTLSHGKVDFEIHATLTYLDTDAELVSADKLFVSCLEDGQKDTCIAIYQPFSGSIDGHIIFYKTFDKCKCTKRFENLPTAFKHLSDDLLIMFNNPDFFPDATLICGNTKFLVHQSIISARSHYVYAKMFSTDMQESQGVVNIVDISPDSLEFILKYRYSGKTDSLNDDMALDLLSAIDKYKLQELKFVCVQKLILKTTVDNVALMLVLGHLYDKSLKNWAGNFICQYGNFSDIEITQDWKMLEQEYQTLAIEVVKSALKYKEEEITKK